MYFNSFLKAVQYEFNQVLTFQFEFQTPSLNTKATQVKAILKGCSVQCNVDTVFNHEMTFHIFKLNEQFYSSLD